MPAIGYVRKDDTGSFIGEFRTLTIKIGVRLVPNARKAKTSHPDYIIVADNGYELGGAWIKQSERGEYLSLALAAPELGRDVFYANMSPAVRDQEGRHAIIWNPPASKGRGRAEADR